MKLNLIKILFISLCLGLLSGCKIAIEKGGSNVLKTSNTTQIKKESDSSGGNADGYSGLRINVDQKLQPGVRSFGTIYGGTAPYTIEVSDEDVKIKQLTDSSFSIDVKTDITATRVTIRVTDSVGAVVEETLEIVYLQYDYIRGRREVSNEIKRDQEGNFYILGYEYLTNGYSWNADQRVFIRKYDQDFVIMPDYGKDGKLEIHFDWTDEVIGGSFDINPDGSIVVTGIGVKNDENQVFVATYDKDANLQDLKLIDLIESKNTKYVKLKRDQNGNSYIYGYYWWERERSYYFKASSFIVKLDKDLEIDRNFANQGIYEFSKTRSNGIKDVLLHSNGSIYIGINYGIYSTGTAGYIYRMNSSGQLDTSFAGSEEGLRLKNPLRPRTHRTVVNLVEIPGSDKIIMGARYQAQSRNFRSGLLKFSTEGIVDQSFGDSGHAVFEEQDIDQPRISESLRKVILGRDGYLYGVIAEGYQARAVFLVKYDLDGNSSRGFYKDGAIKLSIGNRTATYINDLIQNPDMSLKLVGVRGWSGSGRHLFVSIRQ